MTLLYAKIIAMKQKILRYTLGFLLLGLILGAFYFSKGLLFASSILFIILATKEYRNMFKTQNISIHPILPEIAGIFCAYNFIFETEPSSQVLITPVMVSFIMLSFIITILRNKKPYILTTLSSICCFLLIFLGLYIIKLTYYFDGIASFNLICVYFLAVLSGDFAASKFGQMIKSKQISHEISPNKTVAGSLAHLVFSCISCLLLHKVIDLSVIQCIYAGIVISVFAQFGDLSISLIKRDLNLKHSGNLFLNYGGIFDRMDAFLFSAPAFYYFLFIVTII